MKKVPIIHLIGLWAPVLLAAQFAWAEVAADLKQAEELYQAGQYAQAEALYKRIVTDNPRTDAALEAQRGLAMVYARTGQEVLLIQVCESLVGDYSQHQDLPAILGQVADECRHANCHSAAASLYQYLVEHWPDQPKAVFH